MAGSIQGARNKVLVAEPVIVRAKPHEVLLPIFLAASLTFSGSTAKTLLRACNTTSYAGCFIGLFHNGGQIKYSFVLMLISLTSLATTSKFQTNICFKMRAVGLINMKTKEWKSGRH